MILHVAAAIAIGGIWLFLIVQSRWVVRALSLYAEAKQWPDVPDEQLPKAAVVMGLRGSDPSLAESLKSLLNQDYPAYQVGVVIDSETDPAWEQVRPLMNEAAPGRLSVTVLAKRHGTCSLKISSVLQAIDKLDDDCQVIAMVDSDADFSTDWLRRMVRPFQDPEIQVTGGLRWFDGSAGGVATRVRSFWNSFCVAWMCAHRLPWGGCMALRRRFLFDSGLYDELQGEMAEDLTTGRVLREQNAKMAYAPVIGNSRETIGLRSFVTYGRRQLLYARRYDASWPTIVAMNVGSIGAYLIVLAAFIFHLLTAQWMWAAVEGVTIAAYWSCLGIIQARMDARFNPLRRRRWSDLWEIPLAGILAHWLQFDFTLFARFRSLVRWRGVHYRVRLNGDVTIIKDGPYTSPALQETESLI